MWLNINRALGDASNPHHKRSTFACYALSIEFYLFLIGCARGHCRQCWLLALKNLAAMPAVTEVNRTSITNVLLPR